MATTVPKLIKGLQTWSLNNASVLKQVSRGVHSEPQVTALENGVRVVTQESAAPTATVGLYVNTGSRFETDENNGAGYFLEHLAFKGAADKVAEIGGCVEAHTGREQTGFSTKCLPEGVPAAVDILSGAVLNSQFTDGDVAGSKSKILREIDGMEENNLKTVVFDHLHSVAFQETDLGRSVYGPSKNVSEMTKDTLSSYMKQQYQAGRVVLAGAGGVSHNELVDLAKKHLGGMSNSAVATGSGTRYTGSEVKFRDDGLPYAHIAIAVEGCAVDSPDRAALLVAAGLVGSWNRSHGGGTNVASHLARQTADLTSRMHSYESFSINYRDTGLWGIYWVCDKLGCEDMTWSVQDEWKRLATSAKDFEVDRAKNQILANLANQQNCTTAACNSLADGVLSGGNLSASQVQAVDAKAVKNAMFTYLFDQCPAIAAVGPIENQTDYQRVRSGMYWMRM